MSDLCVISWCTREWDGKTTIEMRMPVESGKDNMHMVTITGPACAVHKEMLQEINEQAVKDIIQGWLRSDGFQEGADGATAVAAVMFGHTVVDEWVDECQ